MLLEIRILSTLLKLIVVFQTTNFLAQSNWQTTANQADSLRRSGNYEASIPLYKNVLNTMPKSQKGDLYSNHIRIGLSYFLLGKNKPARYHFEHVLEETNGDNTNIYRGHALNNLGLLYDNTGLFQKSIEYYKLALVLFRKREDQYQIDLVYMNIGIVHKKRGQYKESLSLLTQASAGFTERGDSLQLGEIYSTMAAMQDLLGEASKAKKMYTKSIEIRKSINDKYGLASAYNNMGIIYMNENKIDSAIYYYQSSKNLMSTTSNRNIGLVYHNMGLLSMKENDDKLAQRYFNQAMNHKRSISDTAGMIITLNKCAQLAIKNNHLKSARQYLLESLALLSRSEGLKNRRENYDQWKEYYKRKGNIDSALYFLEQSNILNQAITQKEYQKELALLQETFEADQRENTITQLNRSNQTQKNELNLAETMIKYRNWLIGIALGLILILFGTMYVRKQRSTRRELYAKIIGIEAEKNRLSQELHDVAGTVIRSLKSDLKAQLRTNKKTIRGEFLNFMYQRLQVLSSSIIAISHELKLPNFSQHFFSTIIRDVVYDWNEHKSYNCTVDFKNVNIVDSIPENSALHVYRFILESLTNVDRHAQASDISILTTHNENFMTFTVRDNGISADSPKPGIGHRNLKERAEQVKGHFIFQSNEHGNISSFSIPLKS